MEIKSHYAYTKRICLGTYLMVQWLRLHFTAEAGAGSDSRSHVLQGLARKIIKKNVSYQPAFLLKLPRDIYGYMYVCIHTHTQLNRVPVTELLKINLCINL